MIFTCFYHLIVPCKACVFLEYHKTAPPSFGFHLLFEFQFLTVALLFAQMGSLAYRKMYFEEFCAAAISTHQLEAVEGWEQIASTAFELFEQEGNRVISIEELARVYSFVASKQHATSSYPIYIFLMLL